MEQAELGFSNDDIDRALNEREFYLDFQPTLSVLGGKVTGIESFVRWNHKTLGVIPPALFLTYISQQGRMRELTNYILRNTIEIARNWRDLGTDLVASVNISVDDLKDGTLPTTIELLLREYDFPPENFSVEISEHDLADQFDTTWEKAKPNLTLIKNLGVKITLNSSGPNFLDNDTIDRDLFSTIKIGGPAILRFSCMTIESPIGQMRSRIDFCKENNIEVTAVGVESASTIVGLKQLGFDNLQGNGICPPVGIEEFSAWRRSYSPPSFLLVNETSASNQTKSNTAETAVALTETDDIEAPQTSDEDIHFQEANWSELETKSATNPEITPNAEEVELVEDVPEIHEDNVELEVIPSSEATKKKSKKSWLSWRS